MSGYIAESARQDDSDFELVVRLVTEFATPIFAEGRIWNRERARRAFELGTAITNPQAIIHSRITERPGWPQGNDGRCLAKTITAMRTSATIAMANHLNVMKRQHRREVVGIHGPAVRCPLMSVAPDAFCDVDCRASSGIERYGTELRADAHAVLPEVNPVVALFESIAARASPSHVVYCTRRYLRIQCL